MRRNRLLKIMLLSLAIQTVYVCAKVEPQKIHTQQLRLIESFLSDHHYQHAPLDNIQSREILNNYIDSLDGMKSTFTQIDIDGFKRFETYFDDFVQAGDLETPFDIYDTYAEKRQAQIDWALERLKKPFGDDEIGAYETDSEKIDWAKSDDALKERWRKRLVTEWISLRLAKKGDAKARKTLTKRYKNISKHLRESKSDDVFQMFANSVTSIYDPHTMYFSPRSSEDFDINMSLSLEGIGASLSIEDEVIVVKELIVGGPAIKSGKLARNDKILAVAQGKAGEMEDVVGWRLSDSVRLIRGKRGTIVRLQVEKASSGDVVEISLERDKVKLEESAAKSEIKTIKRDGKDYRIGVIDLPSFYVDFDAANDGDKNYRSTTRDVKKLIEKLKKDGVDGLIIDLRNNGGGSLAEAVDLTGLFFDKGPVVQVLRADGDLTVRRDEDGKTLYDGPLAVLINQNSASASEIFAGAIKDYGRGVILGEPTYGKGTVQTIIDMARFIPSVTESVGQLKMTIAMFYRVNGSSTQIKGVVPDLYIPNKESYEAGGESEEDHALPWREIAPNSFKHSNTVEKVLPQLKNDYKAENTNNPMMKNLLGMLAWRKSEKDKTVVSLSLTERKKRRDDLKAKGLTFQNAFRKLYDYPEIKASDWDKEEKDKTDAEIKAEKDEKIDPILSISTEAVADYVRLLKK